MANSDRKIEASGQRQYDSSDCGAASLVTAVRYYGGDSNIEEIRRLSGTSATGSTMLGLYQAAIRLGLKAEGYEASVKDLIEYNNVLILHVTPEEGLEHFIVCFGYNENSFLIWDPAQGELRMNAGELSEIWKSKKCLGLMPGESFRFKPEEKRQKLRWLLKSIMPEKDLLLSSIAVGVIMSVLGLVMAVYTQKLIDQILPSKEFRLLIISSVLVFVMLMARVLLSAIRQLLLLTQGKLFNIRIVDEFYNSLLFLPKEFFDTRRTGDFVARLNDTIRIQKVIAAIVGTYIIDVLILVVTIVMLFWYSPAAAIISLICLPVFYLLVIRWNKRLISAQHSVMSGYAMSESNFISTLRGILEIKSMNWQSEFTGKNRIIYTDFQERAFSLGTIGVKLGLLTDVAGIIYIMAVLFYSASQVMRSDMSPGVFMAILTLSSSLIPSVMNLALLGVPLSEAKVAMSRMFEFTRIEKETPTKLDEGNLRDINSLTVKDLSFRFPGQKKLIAGLNMEVRKGQLISLVGESGSGKSTLTSLIMRFYDAESGQISVNGTNDSSSLDLVWWRNRIGIVPQEIHIFNGTILQNLITDISETAVESLISIIDQYGLTGFIRTFPSGLLTLIGEEGINLSGGQKQVLAFLRALIKKPDMLIIDEGTSGMDRDTERQVTDLLGRLKSEMGIILISHRINIIKRLSDYIYVLEKGVIAAEGGHEDLLGTDNLYRRFWNDFY